MRAFSIISTVFVLGTFLLLLWQSIPVTGWQNINHSSKSPYTLKPLLSPYQRTNMQQRNAVLIALPLTLETLYPDLEIDYDKIALGEKLFHDPRLSHNNTIACAHCHNLSLGGTDRLPISLGVNGQHGKRNAPTVFNSGLNFRQFWDGRAATLEEQVAHPLHTQFEMNSNWDEILTKLKQDNKYPKQFELLYPQGITAETITDAIAMFERSLHTPNSRFDRFLNGEKEALTQREKEGYQLFKQYGCVSCHQGINIGGNMYQRVGVDNSPPPEFMQIGDLGRYGVTQNEDDRHVFKVPSLRNVAVTPPYFHNGEVKTLEHAVSLMGLHQLKRVLSIEEVALITEFLGTLTGEYHGQPL